MNKIDKNRPVSSIKHGDKRVAIPDSAHQGEEQMAISGMPEQSEYDIFRHEFQRGRDPGLYWLNKYKNDDEDNPDYKRPAGSVWPRKATNAWYVDAILRQHTVK